MATTETSSMTIIAPARDREYLNWVKTGFCVCCARPADDPHHVIGNGLSGMATKVSDYLAFPMCRECHTILHNVGFAAWEGRWGSQFDHVLHTITEAIRQGVVKPDLKELCLAIERVIHDA